MKNVRQGKADTVQGGNKGEDVGGVINQHTTGHPRHLVVKVEEEREHLEERGLRSGLLKGKEHLKGKEQIEEGHLKGKEQIKGELLKGKGLIGNNYIIFYTQWVFYLGTKYKWNNLILQSLLTF